MTDDPGQPRGRGDERAHATVQSVGRACTRSRICRRAAKNNAGRGARKNVSHAAHASIGHNSISRFSSRAAGTRIYGTTERYVYAHSLWWYTLQTRCRHIACTVFTYKYNTVTVNVCVRVWAIKLLCICRWNGTYMCTRVLLLLYSII